MLKDEKLFVGGREEIPVDAGLGGALGSSSSEKKSWHVIYVQARHEKKIHLQIVEAGLESFLPMKKELHTWSDRKKWIDVPLFSSYLFANITAAERNRIFPLSGFVRFVCSSGKPSIVPQWQIDGIKKFIEFCPEKIEVADSDFVGTEGTITAGPLIGMRGKIIEVKNQKFFAIRIDGIEKVLSVTIPVSFFKPLSLPGRVERHIRTGSVERKQEPAVKGNSMLEGR